MTKFYLYVTVLGVLAGGSATLQAIRYNGHPTAPVFEADTSRDASAAFRDGLYLGKLAAQQGSPIRVTSGRWATDSDRTLFAAGYRQGYHEFLASSAANGVAGHSD